jgi:hypothetical protein
MKIETTDGLQYAMPITLEDVLALEALESKLRAILPEQYQYSYEEVLPVSMGSAGLKYAEDGRVAWNEMWASFCDLAMAGGPPHRGALLEPATAEAIAADPEAYHRVVDEIGRGTSLVTGLPLHQSSERQPGWIDVQCRSIGMAGWMVRAIVMENVMARHEGPNLLLPAGPDFRIAREIKNVITSTAKTCHYWTEHMSADQQEAIDRMMSDGGIESELLGPVCRSDADFNSETYYSFLDETGQRITERTGNTCFAHRYVGWIGVEYPNDATAIWLMRAMVVENILCRREGSVLFLPVHPRFSEEGRLTRILDALVRFTRLHALRVRTA